MAFFMNVRLRTPIIPKSVSAIPIRAITILPLTLAVRVKLSRLTRNPANAKSRPIAIISSPLLLDVLQRLGFQKNGYGSSQGGDSENAQQNAPQCGRGRDQHES